MIDFSRFDQRPLIIAITGPNGAGKSTFYFSHLQQTALRFVNADVLARELELDAYTAAGMAAAIRSQLINRRESFIFETVFSDPAGEKIQTLRAAQESGYQVVVCFVGISNSDVSEDRVSMRVSQGGHDVPSEKLASRFPRVLTNLKAAIREIKHVLVFDNDDLSRPYRLVAVYENGERTQATDDLPAWLQGLGV